MDYKTVNITIISRYMIVYLIDIYKNGICSAPWDPFFRIFIAFGVRLIYISKIVINSSGHFRTIFGLQVNCLFIPTVSFDH